MDKQQTESDESDKQIKNEKQKENSDPLLDDGDLVTTFWVRRYFCFNTRVDKRLLDYHFYFLLPIGTIFWVIYSLI
jgi:hypothetical protein